MSDASRFQSDPRINGFCIYPLSVSLYIMDLNRNKICSLFQFLTRTDIAANVE